MIHQSIDPSIHSFIHSSFNQSNKRTNKQTKYQSIKQTNKQTNKQINKQRKQARKKEIEKDKPNGNTYRNISYIEYIGNMISSHENDISENEQLQHNDDVLCLTMNCVCLCVSEGKDTFLIQHNNNMIY